MSKMNQFSEVHIPDQSKLRYYQKECIDKIEEARLKGGSHLVVLPTGSGKSMTFTSIPRYGRILILSHRDELVHQPERYYKNQKVYDRKGNLLPECTFGVEQASEYSNGEEVISASVQSLIRRLDKFDPEYFDTIIIDEAHHAPAQSYRKIISHFKPNLLLGFTATPDRNDKVDLHEIFDDIIYMKDMRWGIEEGFLTDIECFQVNTGYNLDDVKIQMGDFHQPTLAAKMMEDDVMENTIKAYNELRKGQTIIFAVNVEHAYKLQERIPRSVVVEANTPNRDKIFADFTARKFDCLINVFVACLDEQTEILTDKGFVGIDEITYNHKVANWNMDESVYFEEPRNIFKRNLEMDEKMVHVKTKNFDFRVTDSHRMVIYDKSEQRYKKIYAKEVTQHSVFPTNGVAEPFNLNPFPDIEYIPTNRDITRIKWDLIHKQGYPNNDDTIEEAKRRLIKSHTRRYLNPSELTLDQCRLIGFWIADGTVQKLIRSGLEYKLSQSKKYPFIIKWVDDILRKTGIDNIRREKINNKGIEFVEWSLPRGTGGGSQERNGVFPIEPYLDKNGSELLWGLNEDQFDALIEGFWYGDGYHGQADSGLPNTLYFRATDRKPLELLSTIGCVRGWRCSLNKNIKMTLPNHKMQQELRMIKHAKVSTCYRTPIITENYVPQRVWCVQTSSGNIITRRGGKILVMGNCEGTDLPLIETVMMVRPTKNLSLFCQCLGRGLRPAPGKDVCRLIDCVGISKRKLATVGTLFGVDEAKMPEKDKDKLQGIRLTKMEGVIEAALDTPEFWISNKKQKLFESDNEVSLRYLNFVPLANDTLVLSLPNFEIKIPPIDALGNTKAIFVVKKPDGSYGKPQISPEGSLQETIDRVHSMLTVKMVDTRILWDKRLIERTWGKAPASDKQKNYIKRLAEINHVDLSGVNIDGLTKHQAGIIIERINQNEKLKAEAKPKSYSPYQKGKIRCQTNYK